MQAIQDLRQDMREGQTNSKAYSFNCSATTPESKILPLSDGNGNLPRNFPGTKDGLIQSTHAEVNALLTFYGIAFSQAQSLAELHIQKNALFAHLGLR
jgi:hypothetical protein